MPSIIIPLTNNKLFLIQKRSSLPRNKPNEKACGSSPRGQALSGDENNPGISQVDRSQMDALHWRSCLCGHPLMKNFSPVLTPPSPPSCETKGIVWPLTMKVLRKIVNELF
ncbi:hypothetical protein CEXT_815611 [Caerostris extrusa]|uniref:Uncharacterized protein n=1 Tax=Caerostris extrusa TaxID=172846 RepID=A0AAV4S327_CAEEX|nr:hypothetical protein CEXT_815611 [Caerostris extrusa]